MGTGSQCLPIAREPENLTIPGHGGGPGRVPCAIRAHPVQPLLRLFAAPIFRLAFISTRWLVLIAKPPAAACGLVRLLQLEDRVTNR